MDLTDSGVKLGRKWDRPIHLEGDLAKATLRPNSVVDGAN